MHSQTFYDCVVNFTVIYVSDNNKTLICELSGDINKIWKYLKFTEVTVREIDI